MLLLTKSKDFPLTRPTMGQSFLQSYLYKQCIKCALETYNILFTSNRVKRSIICCQGFLAQIQDKMTLSLNKTIGYCFLSGLCELAQWKTSPKR